MMVINIVIISHHQSSSPVVKCLIRLQRHTASTLLLPRGRCRPHACVKPQNHQFGLCSGRMKPCLGRPPHRLFLLQQANPLLDTTVRRHDAASFVHRQTVTGKAGKGITKNLRHCRDSMGLFCMYTLTWTRLPGTHRGLFFPDTARHRADASILFNTVFNNKVPYSTTRLDFWTLSTIRLVPSELLSQHPSKRPRSPDPACVRDWM
jgi:hypothetical protein